MPHLSPMSWLNIMIIVWFMLMILNTQMWWSPSKSIKIKKLNKTTSLNNYWNW